LFFCQTLTSLDLKISSVLTILILAGEISMSILKNVRALSITSGILILALICVIVVTLKIETMMNEAHSNKFVSFGLASDLRQGSQDLTRLARTYVVTTDPKYKEMYWDIVKVRGGQKERPDGRKNFSH
jgi:methyl-accepting chemotaxis protein